MLKAKMKCIVFAALFLSSHLYAMAQQTVVELDHLDVVGVIFDKAYEPHFALGSITDRFTPSRIDIERSEELISKFDLKSRKPNKSNRRQYLGFEKKGNRYLLVHVMYYKCKKQFSDDFPSWDNTFAYLFTEPDDDQKSFLYVVNLLDNTIGFFDPH